MSLICLSIIVGLVLTSAGPAFGGMPGPGSFVSPAVLGELPSAHLQSINKSVSRETLKALSTPDGGERISEDW